MKLSELKKAVDAMVECGNGDAEVLLSLHSDSSSTMGVDDAEYQSQQDVIDWLEAFADDFGIDWDLNGVPSAGVFFIRGECEFAYRED